MVAEGNETHNRSVRCIFCAQPIVLSPNLASLYVVAKDENQNAEERRQSRVMLLRCSKCSREAPYRRDDVITSNPDPMIGAAESTSPQNLPKAFRRAAS